jgi:hypothetical protein
VAVESRNSSHHVATGNLKTGHAGLHRVAAFAELKPLGTRPQPGLRPTRSAVAHSLRSFRASDGRPGPEPQPVSRTIPY